MQFNINVPNFTIQVHKFISGAHLIYCIDLFYFIIIIWYLVNAANATNEGTRYGCEGRGALCGHVLCMDGHTTAAWAIRLPPKTAPAFRVAVLHPAHEQVDWQVDLEFLQLLGVPGQQHE